MSDKLFKTICWKKNMGTICGKKIHFKTSLQKFVQKPHRKYLGGRKLESGFKSRAGYNGARKVYFKSETWAQ